MVLSNITFVQSESVNETLKMMFPEAKQINLIEHGYDNIVGIIDDTYAVRFPRNKDAYTRSQLEKVVLHELSGLKNIALPNIIEEKRNPYCLVTTYISGKHLSPTEIANLSATEQAIIGEDVARFAFEMHNTLSVDEIRKQSVKIGINRFEDWPTYFARVLKTPKLLSHVQNDIAREFYKNWELYNDGRDDQVVVHDDLHNENVFFKRNHLSGVLDFGDTSIGIPEQDLRHLYRINKEVLEAAIRMYEKLSDKQLSLDTAINWAITQELASFAHRLQAGETTHPAFTRSCINLDRWLPEGNWSEGFDINKISLR